MSPPAAPSTPPAGGTTAELVLHATVAGHPLELAAVIGSGSWEFAGTLNVDAGRAPDLADLLRSLLAQAGLGAIPAGMIPSVAVRQMTARYAAESFALAGTFEIGEARGPLRVLFASLPPGRGCVVALGFDAEIPLRVDVLRGVVPDISLSGLRVVYASEAVEDLPEPVAALVPVGAANGRPRALARGLSLGGRLGTATDGHDLMLTQPPADTPEQGTRGDRAAAPEPDGGAFRTWVAVDRTFGPLALRRVGGEWNGAEGRLGLLLDAAVDLFGLRVGLAGLKVSLPLKDPPRRRSGSGSMGSTSRSGRARWRSAAGCCGSRRTAAWSPAAPPSSGRRRSASPGSAATRRSAPSPRCSSTRCWTGTWAAPRASTSRGWRRGSATTAR